MSSRATSNQTGDSSSPAQATPHIAFANGSFGDAARDFDSFGERFPRALDATARGANGSIFVTDNGFANLAVTAVVMPQVYQPLEAEHQPPESRDQGQDAEGRPEVSRRYVPSTLTRRVGVSGMNLSLVGRNLALWTKYRGIDPENDFTAPGASSRNVRVFLLGSAFGALLHQRGLLPLHANAVEVDGRAVATLIRFGRFDETATGFRARR